MRDTTTWISNLLIAVIIWNFGQCHVILANSATLDEFGFTGAENDFSMQGTPLPETIILESPSSTPNFTYLLEGKEASVSNYDDFSEERSSSSNFGAPFSSGSRLKPDNDTESDVKRNKNNDFNQNDDESFSIDGDFTRKNHRDKTNDQRQLLGQLQQSQSESQQVAATTNTTTLPDLHYKRNERVLRNNSKGFYGPAIGSNGSEDAVTSHKISAFELHKSHRRNNKRYGHRNLKKKYKDYLRHLTQNIGTPDKKMVSAESILNASTDSSPRTQIRDAMMKQYNRGSEHNQDVEKIKPVRLLLPHSIFSDQSATSNSHPYYQEQMDDDKMTESDVFDSNPTKSNLFRNAVKTFSMANLSDQRKKHKHHSYQWENRKNHHHQGSRLNSNINRSSNRHRNHYHHHSQNDQRHHHHQSHRYNHNYNRKIVAPAIANEKDINVSGSKVVRQRWPNDYYDSALSTSQFNQYPVSSQVGHQITQMEEFDKYYSKWPHLAQLQYQLNEDDSGEDSPAAIAEKERANYRYRNPTSYYKSEDASTAAGGNGMWRGKTGKDLDDNPVKMDGEKSEDYDDNDDQEEEDLPPYIKKYNRRNKLLLNLLEGTLPPPSPPPSASKNVFRVWSTSVLQPGPRDSSPYARKIKIQNEKLNKKRKNEDIFDEQRMNLDKPVEEVTTTPTMETAAISSTNYSTNSTFNATITTLSPFDELLTRENDDLLVLQNQLPGDDVSISQELFDWEKDIAENFNGEDSQPSDWNMAKSSSSSSLSATKAEKQHSSGLIAVPRNRGSGNRKSNFISGSNYQSNSMFSALSALPTPFTYPHRRDESIIADTKASTSKPINSFVYHRVMEAPRLVGAGLTGRKQRLPFVAITDRRLETSKKIRQRDFEQNQYPMP